MVSLARSHDRLATRNLRLGRAAFAADRCALARGRRGDGRTAGTASRYGGFLTAGSDWQRRLSLASTLPGEPGFEPKRYWRGPVWAVINWMIAEGLARHGQDALAARLRRVTATAIARGGFAEYFDPMTGAPLGGDAFSWTASIALVLSDCSLASRSM